jgi:hypothetical protein
LRKILPLLTILYPFVIFLLRDSAYFMAVALNLGGLLILDLLYRLKLSRKMQILGLSGLLLLVASVAWVGVENVVRLYPFIMSGSMLLLFAASKDPKDNPMIGPLRRRIANDPRMLGHLHRAKWIWIVGLSFNTLVLGVFLFAFPLQIWILYASFYSYILLASLLVLSVAYVALARRNLL